MRTPSRALHWRILGEALYQAHHTWASGMPFVYRQVCLQVCVIQARKAPPDQDVNVPSQILLGSTCRLSQLAEVLKGSQHTIDENHRTPSQTDRSM